MTTTAVMLSARLGGSDGVSVEASKWQWALTSLGFAVRRVAGELPDDGHRDDVVLPWLAIEPAGDDPPGPAELAAVLDGSDLVVVENLCSLPLNLDASRAAVAALDAHEGRVAFHHHDLPWQRERLAQVAGFPPRRDNSLHVTINDRSRHELAERGIEATTIRNVFHVDGARGDRGGMREAAGFADTDLVVLQPTRAIARKDVRGGVRFAEELARVLEDREARYWITGAAEEGYGPMLERIVSEARVPVTHVRAPRAVDAYAAADIVVLPSTWEGFGNPVIESAIARRPLAVRRYPVLEEIADLGFRWFDVEDPDAAARWLREPDAALLDDNLALARRHFSLTDLPARLEAAFASVGWSAW